MCLRKRNKTNKTSEQITTYLSVVEKAKEAAKDLTGEVIAETEQPKAPSEPAKTDVKVEKTGEQNIQQVQHTEAFV